MNLVQASFLIGGLAVLLPILVHLLNRWQIRRVEIGTMRFLNEVIRDGAQKRRIRRWFLLLTRMALVALLAVLFARPFMVESSRRDGDRLRVVLIDRSASMSMPGRQGRLVDDAVSEAIKSASELGEDAKLVWAWFDRVVEPIAETSIRLNAPKVVSGGTNYQAAFAYARDQVHANPTSVADVVLVTDLQNSGMRDQLAVDSEVKFPEDVRVHIVDVGRAAASNLAISNLAIPSTRMSADRRAILTATLFNYGSLPFEDVSIVAAATLGSRTVRLKKTVQIAAGQAQEVEFDLDKLTPGTWQCSVSLDANDDLASDNVRYAAMEVTRPYEVLVIDRNKSNTTISDGSSSYLITALRQGTESLELVAPERSTNAEASKTSEQGRALDVNNSITSEGKKRSSGRFSPRWVDLEKEGFPSISTDKLSLVAVANAGNMTGSDIERLERIANDGGKLLIFAGSNSDSNGLDWVQLWNDSQLAPGHFSKPRASGVSPFRISSFATGSSMLEPFDDPQHGDLKRLSFHTILPVEPANRTRVLAWFDEQKPAITQHSVGKGTAVFFLSSSDSSWSSWTLSPLFLPLVQQMSAELLNLNGEGPIRFRSIGDMLSTASSDRINDVTKQFVSARSHAVDRNPSPSVSSKPIGQTFEQAGFEKREDALYVVNTIASESDPTRVSMETLAERYGLSLAVEKVTNLESTVGTTKKIELWPWLAAGLIVLLVFEFALANRTAP